MMDTPDDFTGPVNLGNPRESTIRELAELVLAVTGSRSKLVFMPLPQDDPMQRRPDISSARDKLHWEPHTSLEDGLTRTVAYFDALLTADR
jgi:UDP-glucuronate decarboxylase